MTMTMTEHISVTHLTDHPTTTSTDELVRVPAADVVIEDNVRTIADLDPAFVASIKQHGVLLPTIGYRNTDGQVVVRDGQLRVLAARETGHDVPVFVTARDVTDAQRLVEQVVTNDRRTALTDGDRLAAYRQMELAGLSVTAIAKQTGTKRTAVKDTLTVAKSAAATEAVTERQMTFDDALIFAEFDGDQDAIDSLNHHLEYGYGSLAVHAERIRQDRARTAAAAALVVEYEANGVRVIDRETAHVALWGLTDAEPEADTERSPLTAATHLECLGRAVYVPADYGDPRVVEVCTTPDAHHELYPSSRTEPTPELTEEEADAAREAARQARRALIENNKQWAAAEVIRRDWLATFLQRRAMPKDTSGFIGRALTVHGTTRHATGEVDASSLLGIEAAGWEPDLLGAWLGQHPTKGLHLSLAVLFAGFENHSSRDWWRHPDRHSRGYLTQLAAWGYPLSRVEQIAAGSTPEPDDATTEPGTAPAEPDTGDLAPVTPITADGDGPEQPDAA